MPDETPRYRLLEKAYIHDHVHEVGAEVETELDPGFHMEPLNAAAKRRVAEVERRKGRSNPNDPTFMLELANRIAGEGNAMSAGDLIKALAATLGAQPAGQSAA